MIVVLALYNSEWHKDIDVWQYDTDIMIWHDDVHMTDRHDMMAHDEMR